MIAQAIVWYLSFAHFMRGGGGSKILKSDGAALWTFNLIYVETEFV